MKNATAKTAQPKKQPERKSAEVGSVKLEYVRKRATVAKLFHLEDLANVYPSLNEYVPVRVYYIAGTDTEFDHPMVPNINMNYKFDVFELAVLLPYFIGCKGFPPYLYGLHGTGKSSVVEQIHARLGLPKAHIILGEDSEVLSLGGQMLPTEAGSMRFHEGLLVQSMRYGWTLQIDEYDLFPTRQQKMLNEVLENRRFTIEETGVCVEAHPDWRICVTGNTNNTGSGHHMFTSSGSGDASVNERFQFVEKHYMSLDDERQVLINHARSLLPKHPKLSKNPADLDKLMIGIEQMINQMLDVAKTIRTAHENSMNASQDGVTLNCTMSTRALKEWLRCTIDLSAFFNGAKNDVLRDLTRRSLLTTFVRGVDAEEQQDVLQIFDDLLNI
ncbi:AAA family ATPase [Enterovibrio norvegicus]|uniref:AAA family ATPase n=1 Tax=Enterovibrio norvegicus TaxID=188144 RepID=UPI000C832C65|nr:AAA family ATPase [Enterovibrio norvegicus]PMH64465.1 hypothetical protein BCU62_15535 [Enterovibrio norvegicus]